MIFVQRLVYLRRFRVARALLLILFGVDLPAQVRVGRDFQLVHRGLGTVVNGNTVIGDRVRIYHQVTIGRLDAHLPLKDSKMNCIEICDDVVLFPGSKILGGDGVTRIGNGTIVAANAVVTSSTGPNEIWGGIPAKKIGDRGAVHRPEKA